MENTGSIKVKDLSANFAAMPRAFGLFNQNNVLLSSTELSANEYTFTNLASGTYVMKLSTGCATVQQTVIVPKAGLDAKITGTNVLCLGTGTELTASGGTSYLWDNGATSSSITALPNTVGTKVYKVQVTNGTCTKEASYTVTVKAAPTAQISGPNSTCYNGSVTLSGSGSGSYAWSTGANTSSISTSLLQSSQTYRLTVTDPSTQCSSVDEHVVTVLPRPTLNEAPTSICMGGTVNLSVSGGSSYSWNVGGTTASIQHSPSSSTEYRVTVTDASGCSYVLSKNIAVTNPPNITFGGGTSICAGQSLNITAFGGSSYSWSYNSANTATITVSPVVNTTYTVTATSSGGCVSTAQRAITVKPSPTGNIDAPSSICPGQSVTLIASGGTSYAWNGGASTASITVSPTQNTNYTVSISNGEGCTVVKSHAIAVNISGSASNDGPLTCIKTSATLTGASSAQGATYRWKNASGVTIANTANTTVTSAGVYTLEITAAGACTYSTATEVLQNLQTPSVSASNSGAITCTQSSVNLLGTSSATPATYEWRNGGGTLIANTLNTSVTQAGTYTLKVTTANGCSSTASTTVTTDVATPQASIQHDGPLSCTKTSVTLSASPNNPNLQYTWRNSSGTVIASNSSSVVVTATGTYQLEAKGSNGCTTTVSTNITQSGNFPNISVNNPGYISCTSSGATISGNSTTPGVTYAWYNPNGRLMATQKSFVTNIAGTYTLKVTSAEGCVSSASTTLGEDVPNDQAITLNVGGYSTNGSFAQGELTCTQNSIRLSVSARYAGYDVAVYWRTDADGVIGSGNFENVDAPGYYYVYHQECPAVVKEIYIKENRPAPVVQITGEKLVCVDKNTTLMASGGNQYYWSTGATTNTISPYVSGPTTYTVTVSKGAYCNTTASVTVDNHPYPIFNISGPTSSCAGTFVTLTVSGGHTYRWSHNNATTASINVAPTVPTAYTVTVTSDKGCVTNRRHTISTVNSQPNDFRLNGEPTTAFCGEAPVNISVVNPNSNYTWKWSTGETTSYLQRTITSSQTISVTARRSNGRTRTKTIPITVNTKPQGFIAGADINCAGESTTLTAPLGETYLWSTGATSSSISVKPESDQTYSVTVSNAGGTCSASFEKTVTVPAPLSLSHDLEGEDDCIPNNAAVLPTVSGGTGSIKLGLIRSGELYVSENLNGLPSGTYLLRAKDTKGCIALDEVVIKETPATISELKLSGLNDCTPGNTQMEIVTTGDRLPLIYRLNGTVLSGKTTTLPRTAGAYTIEVEDAAGCKVSKEDYFDDYDALQVLDNNITHVSDCSTPNGAIHMTPILRAGDFRDYNLSVDGGTTWHNATNLVLNLPPGKYPTSARSNLHGCTMTGPEVQINAPDCLPEAGFTQSVLHITSPTQRIALPWRVDKRPWGNADKPFSLHVYRVGDGKPHFVDPNIATATEPQEKSLAEGSAGFTIEYAVDFAGSDERELVLQPNVADHLEPGFYTFMMEGEGVAVDQNRKEIKVIVDLDGRVVVVPFACKGGPIRMAVSHPEPEDCYYWPDFPNEKGSVVNVSDYTPGKVYRVEILRDLKIIPQLFVGDALAQENIPYQIKSSLGNQLCKGEHTFLDVSTKPGKDATGWSFKWKDLSNNSSEDHRRVDPETDQTFTLEITNKDGCKYELSQTITVADPKLELAKIIPEMPTACNGGNTTIGVELAKNPKLKYNYNWYVDGAFIRSAEEIKGDKIGGRYSVIIEARNPITNVVCKSEDLSPVLLSVETFESTYKKLEAMGFKPYPCRLITTPGSRETPELRDACTGVEDFSGVGEIEWDATIIDLKQRVCDDVTAANTAGFGARGYLFEGICEPNFQPIMRDVRTDPHNMDQVIVYLDRKDSDDDVFFQYFEEYDKFLEEAFLLKLENELSDKDCKGTDKLATFGGSRASWRSWAVQKDYIDNVNPLAEGEFQIPKASADGHSRGYADIAVPAFGEIYEVKPERQDPAAKLLDQAQLQRYIVQARFNCRPTIWKAGRSYPPLGRYIYHVEDPLNKVLYAYMDVLDEPGIIRCRDISRKDVQVPFPIPPILPPINYPKNTVNRLKEHFEKYKKDLEKLAKELAEDAREGSKNLEREITKFLRENPEVLEFLKKELQVAIVTGAVTIAIATIAEDIATGGLGIADDVASFALVMKLFQIAAKI